MFKWAHYIECFPCQHNQLQCFFIHKGVDMLSSCTQVGCVIQMTPRAQKMCKKIKIIIPHTTSTSLNFYKGGLSQVSCLCFFFNIPNSDPSILVSSYSLFSSRLDTLSVQKCFSAYFEWSYLLPFVRRSLGFLLWRLTSKSLPLSETCRSLDIFLYRSLQTLDMVVWEIPSNSF